MKPKPAFFAARTLQRELGGRSFAQRIPPINTRTSIDPASVFVLAFSGARLAVWTNATATTTGVVQFPVASLVASLNATPSPSSTCWNRRSMNGTAAATVCAVDGILSVASVSGAPAYFTPQASQLSYSQLQGTE
jgi:hypothetical protein